MSYSKTKAASASHDDPGPCLRPPEVARRLGIATRTVIRLLRAKKLPGVKLNRLWLVPEKELEQFLLNLQQRLKDSREVD